MLDLVGQRKELVNESSRVGPYHRYLKNTVDARGNPRLLTADLEIFSSCRRADTPTRLTDAP
jgi:hypothetical protein